jgi:hypothetical protein
MAAPGARAGPPPVSREAVLVLAGIGALAAVLYGIYWTPIGPDDPWITYRYAENLASGLGFVYNAGERVLGSSTPLYVMLLAALHVVGLPVPATSWVIGFGGMIAALLLTFLLVRRLAGEPPALVAAGLLATALLFHRVATYGMETPLYVTLILGAFVAYLSGRDLLAAALAALCVVARVDGGAVGLALAVTHLVTRRTMPWKAAAVYVAIAAPWFLFSLAYFGVLTPNTVAAKRMHTQHTVLLWMPRWILFEPRSWLAAIGAAVALLDPRMRRSAAPVVLWAAVYGTAFTLVGMQRYDWYQTPLLPVLCAFAGIGVWAAATRVTAGGAARVAVSLGLAALLAVPDARKALRRWGGDEGILGVERVRYEAVLWMRDSLPAGAPIATGGIGLVGYHTRRTVIDAMGLVTPQAIRIEGRLANPRTMPFPRFLPAVIEDFEPEYVFDGFRLAADERMPAFMQGSYEVVKEWRGADPEWPRFVLYRRTAPRTGSRGPG